MAVNLTIAQLFGSLSKPNRPEMGYSVDLQRFGFAGIDGEYGASLGNRGLKVIFTGQMRASGASLAFAAAAMNTITTTIYGYISAGTVINLFVADSTAMATLYGTSQYSRLVCEAFRETAVRSAVYAATPIIVVPFACVLRKVI